MDTIEQRQLRRAIRPTVRKLAWTAYGLGFANGGFIVWLVMR